MMGHWKPINYKVGILILGGIFIFLFVFGDHTTEVHLQALDLVQNAPKSEDTKVRQILSNVTSGQEFNGRKFRSFRGTIRFENVDQFVVKEQQKSAWNCTKWGVVTTIFAPSESVRRFLYRHDWCVVVVGDQDKPKVRQFQNPYFSAFLYFKVKA